MYIVEADPVKPEYDFWVGWVHEEPSQEELQKLFDWVCSNDPVDPKFYAMNTHVIRVREEDPSVYVHPDDCRDTLTEWVEEWEKDLIQWTEE